MNFYRLTLGFLLMTLSCFGQLSEKDSLNITFKAKLLTTSYSGLTDSEIILKDILNQEIKFIPNPTKNIILIKISFDQKYFQQIDKTSIDWFGICDYYLAYNLFTSKFYRLGGFDFIDIDQFFDDLKKIPSKEWVDLVFGQNPRYDNFDFHCLHKYYELKPRKRFKKGYSCFDCCSKVLVTDIKDFNRDGK